MAPLTSEKRFDNLGATRSLSLPATAQNRQVSSAAVQVAQTANRELTKYGAQSTVALSHTKSSPVVGECAVC